jgi:GrpB-like predicted nucleotidyltransferase (UPF0157 family)
MTSHDEAFAAWRKRRAVDGEAVGLIDLYQLVAGPKGLKPEELPREERVELARRAFYEMAPGFALLPDAERRLEPIEIVPYDARWPAIFQDWKGRMLEVLTQPARIEHVGSTAVPGLPAKPIVDIQVSVADLKDERAYRPALESLGIRLRSRDDEHRYFHPPAERPRDVHVHVCSVGSRWERSHILFVAYLRRDAPARDSYVVAKREAAAKWRDDRAAYTDAKNGVIGAIMARAEAWAVDTGWSP